MAREWGAMAVTAWQMVRPPSFNCAMCHEVLVPFLGSGHAVQCSVTAQLMELDSSVGGPHPGDSTDSHSEVGAPGLAQGLSGGGL